VRHPNRIHNPLLKAVQCSIEFDDPKIILKVEFYISKDFLSNFLNIILIETIKCSSIISHLEPQNVCPSQLIIIRGRCKRSKPLPCTSIKIPPEIVETGFGTRSIEGLALKNKNLISK